MSTVEDMTNNDNVVHCVDCRYLDIEDNGMYATCAKAHNLIDLELLMQY